MEQVRLGIIGVGNMGSGHTANIMAGKSAGSAYYSSGRSS